MQKALILILFTCLLLPGYSKKAPSEGRVSVMDISGSCDSYIVARDPEAHLDAPSALLHHKDNHIMYTLYIRRDVTRNMVLSKSSDGGKTWRDISVFRSPETAKEYNSVSMFGLGRTYFRTNKNRMKPLANNSMLIFAGGVPLYSSISVENEERFYDLRPVTSFGAYRITGLQQLRDGRLMALFHDDGRFIFDNEDNIKLRKSAIYKIYSSDGGKTWSEPVMALKHNLYGLYDAAVFRSPRKRDKELIMITSERATGASYISFSENEGGSWTYPELLPEFIHGDRFGVVVVGKELYIVYRDLCRQFKDGTSNPYFGDIVMWTGDIKELVKGNKNGVKIRIADNYPTDEQPDYEDLKFSDCGYSSVLPLPGGRLAVVAYGRWDKNEMPYIKNFIVNAEELDPKKR